MSIQYIISIMSGGHIPKKAYFPKSRVYLNFMRFL